MIFEIFGAPATGKTVAAKSLEECGVKLIKSSVESIRFIISKEFFEFMKIVAILPNTRYKNVIERARKKCFLLFSYLNMMNARSYEGVDGYLFSGIIEQFGGYLWYETDTSDVLVRLIKHINKYMKDVKFIYMCLPDYEKLYNRMMGRSEMVNLCRMPKKDALDVIERLDGFFYQISNLVDGKVIMTNLDLANTCSEIKVYYNLYEKK